MERRLDGPALALGLLALGLIGGVFALDVLTPPEVAAGALYALVVFYSWLMRSSAAVVGAGVACSLLVFVELFLGTSGQSDVVGVNKIMTRPVWDGTQFIPRKIMNLSSSFDHRIVDGWDAAVFVQRIKALLETPALIFIEG